MRTSVWPESASVLTVGDVELAPGPVEQPARMETSATRAARRAFIAGPPPALAQKRWDNRRGAGPAPASPFYPWGGSQRTLLEPGGVDVPVAVVGAGGFGTCLATLLARRGGPPS